MNSDAPPAATPPDAGAVTPSASQPSIPSPNHALSPPPVPDHELIRRIGQGSYGEVWLARHTRLGTLRAVKIVRRHQFENDRPF
jgi:serine/threonine protein kinase